MLGFRTISLIVIQGIIALVFFVLGKENAWNISEGWWFVSGFCTNVITLYLLIVLNRKEGQNFFDVLKLNKKGWWKDLLSAIGIILIAIPIFFLSGSFISDLLFGKDVANEFLFRPVPVVVVYVGLLWGLTQGLVEIPTYWVYSFPKISKRLSSPIKAWLICSIAITIQHVAVPFILDFNYVIWRIGSYFLMSALLGFAMIKRPALTPFLMIIQSTMDCLMVIGILAK